MKSIGGWKTITGAAMILCSIVLSVLGQEDLGKQLMTAGIAAVAVGIGHKIEKAKKTLQDVVDLASGIADAVSEHSDD